MSHHFSSASWVCNTLQRYKFESNSQHNKIYDIMYLGCVIPCKDTNLKAIHNTPEELRRDIGGV